MEKEMPMTANEFYLEGMATMKKHSLVKVEHDVHPKFFLTHIENRDKLMLNAKQVQHVVTLDTSNAYAALQ